MPPRRRTLLRRALTFGTLVIVAAVCDHPLAPRPVPIQPEGAHFAEVISGPAVLVGAGNVARCDRTDDEATADLIEAIDGTVIVFGDPVRQKLGGSAAVASADYNDCYGAPDSWSQFNTRVRPVPGEVDYTYVPATGEVKAQAYFNYFGAAAGTPGKGYYSYELGDWHVIALNSQIDITNGSEQVKWLKAELAASTKSCTIAYFHHARFVTGPTGQSVVKLGPKPIWDVLYGAGVEVVLAGIRHNYERFAPQTPEGVLDPEYGIRQFIVGTGGHDMQAFGTTLAPNSEVRYDGGHGVLKLSLGANSLDWQFLSVSGKTFTDAGTVTCHVAPPPVAHAGGPYDSGPLLTFDGSQSYDPQGDALTSYEWDFGDGNIGSGVKPTHTYAEYGSYNVTLIVTDANGNRSRPATTTATIRSVPPTVDAGADVRTRPGRIVALDTWIIDAQGDAPWNYTVNWGDGASEQGSTAAIDQPVALFHEYASTGQYAVTVSVSDATGLTGSDALNVIVSPPGTSEVLLTASDIAFCGSNGDEETAKLLDRIEGMVFTGGDNANENGTAQAYRDCYEPTWGRHKDRTLATMGNHEYNISPEPAYDYFRSRIGPRGKAYYSYDLGDWHIVVLNQYIPYAAGSEQDLWLQQDLAASKAPCTAAIFHEPLYFSSNRTDGDNDRDEFRIFWERLYEAGADIVLGGHDHHYERLAPMNPPGERDDAYGLRQFTVGTGGHIIRQFTEVSAPNREVHASVFGILKLTLNPTSYSWEFVPIAGSTFTDTGSGDCHGKPGEPPPTPPTLVTVQSAPNPSTYTQDVTFTTTVTRDGSPVTSGNVRFIQDGSCSTPETVLAGPIPVDANGQASFTTAALTVVGSPHTITGCYDGTTSYQPASGNVAQTVERATANVWLEDLEHAYDGTAKRATAKTDATGTSTFSITYDGSATEPIAVGSYAVSAILHNDNYTGSASGTLTIASANTAPVANADAYAAVEDQPLVVTGGGVLANDTDADASTLTAAVVTPPAHGTLALQPDGSFTFTPNADFNGTDSFTYSASDGELSSTATATLTVAPVNDAPSFVQGADQTAAEDAGPQTVPAWATSISAGPADEGGQQLTFDVAAQNTSLFSAQPAITPDGTLSFTSAPGASGSSLVTVRLRDDGGVENGGVDVSADQTFTISISDENDTPVAVEDAYALEEDGQLAQPAPGVLANDNDPDGSSLTAVLAAAPAHGALTLNADGSFTYTPAADFNGDDAFQYQASDGGLSSAPVRVALTVQAVNDAPSTEDDSYTVEEDNTLRVGDPPTASAPGVVGVLANDTDVDADQLAATLVSGPAHGGLTLNADGSFTYAPEADFVGTDAFMYQASDGNGGTDAATVTIVVTPTNDAPVAADQSVTTEEDTPLSIALTATDTDGDASTFVIATPPAHGTLTGGADGVYTYTPASDYHGSDQFTFTASDGSATSAPATVSITVTPANDAPVGTADQYTTSEDTELAIAAPGVLANDGDVDGSPLTATLVAAPAHGTIALEPSGAFRYTPAPEYTGDDAFTYQVSDGELTSEPITVALTIMAANDAPVALSQSLTTEEDVVLSGQLAATDADDPSSALQFAVATAPANGTVVLGADGAFTYTPAADYHGPDGFTFTATDGADAVSAPAEVTISVTSVNDAPVAADQSVATDEDTPVATLLGGSDPDGDALTYTIVSAPSHGTLSGTAPELTYTPAAGFHGSDAFTFRVDDGTAESAVATVSITVASTNDAPIANAQSVTIQEDTPQEITLTGSDSDDDPLTFEISTEPTNGTLTPIDGGTFRYTPAPDFHGADQFTFDARDPDGAAAQAIITLTVMPVNDAPVALDDAGYTTVEDTPLDGTSVLANDSDADLEGLTAELVAAPPSEAAASFTLNSDGTFRFVPASEFAGEVQFQYQARDATGALSGVATATIIVTPVNDAPVAADQSVTTQEDVALEVSLTATDGEGDAPTFAIVSPPAHGTLSGGIGGIYTYTPAADFYGQDGFTFTASDGSATSAPATVSITVTLVNDGPVADAQSVTLSEDTPQEITLTATDLDGDALAFAIVSAPANGSLSGDGAVYTYTPAADFHGADAFTFEVSDPSGAVARAAVSLTVLAANDAPVAVDDPGYTTPEDTPLSGTSVLANDSDADAGDTRTAALVTGPQSEGTASFTLGSDGTFAFTPAADFTGTLSFTYQVRDGAGALSNVATASVTVTPLNDAPSAADLSVTTDEDVAVATTLAGADPDGDALTYTLVSGPSNGTLSGTAPALVYTPNGDFHGADAFTYRVSDGSAESGVATVSITVAAANDAPTADAQQLELEEDGSHAVTLTGTDPDGDALAFEIVEQPVSGTLTGSGATYTYTPAADFTGTDRFTFVARDAGGLASAPAIVMLTVRGVNDAPVGAEDQYNTTEDTELVIAAPGVLANDRDAEGSSLTASLVEAPAHGTLALDATGGFRYTPAPDYAGSDAFTYQVSDGVATSAPVAVTLAILEANDAPVALPQSLTTEEDVAVSGTVAATDVDGATTALRFAVAAAPAHGTLSLAPDGAFNYTPAADYYGSDRFTFTATDAGGAVSAPAEVTITVTAANDAPAAVDQSVTTDEDTPAAIQLVGTDPEGEALTYTMVTVPANGTLTGTAPALTYTPATDFHGSDAFTFRVGDGSAESSVATVAITVSPVNDAPAASADVYATEEDQPLTIEAAAGVLANDSDRDADRLTAELEARPTHGSLVLQPDGSFTYTPAANYSGGDSFTYRATDGALSSEVTTVTLSIGAANDAPVADAQSVTLDEDTPREITLTGTDADGEALTFAIAPQPANGSLTLVAGATFLYTPAADFHGADAFTFEVSDPSGAAATAVVSLTVVAVNDAPVAVDDAAYTTAEDTPLGGSSVLANDSDVDGDALTAELVAAPQAEGMTSFTLNGDGTFQFVPAPDFTGEVQFRYQTRDAAGALSGIATATITVTPANDAPVAVDQGVTTEEDLAVAITLAATDAEGDAPTFAIAAAPAHGTLSSGTGGVYTYTPAPDYYGADQFTFTASDGSATSAPATVDITVAPVNDAPTAADRQVSTDEDESVTVTLEGADIDGDALAYAVASAPTQGTLSGSGQALLYTPAPDFHGEDVFTYHVSDAGGLSATASVTITVRPANDQPTITTAAPLVGVQEGREATNGGSYADADAGDAVQLSASVGTLVQSAGEWSWSFTPADGPTETQVVTISATDGATASAVTFELRVENVPPTAEFTAPEAVSEGGTIAVALSNAIDVDADLASLQYAFDCGAGFGPLGSSATAVCSPASSAATVSVRGRIVDKDGGESVYSRAVRVDNVAPVAAADAFSTNEDAPLAVPAPGLLANDGDAGQDALSAELVTEPLRGTVTVLANGSFTYTPASDYNGEDSFTYRAFDGSAYSAPATVTVSIAAVDDPPVLAPIGSRAVDEGTVLTFTAVGSDIDTDGLQFSVAGAPTGASIDAATGAFGWEPTEEHGPGSYTFVVRVTAGLLSDEEQVTVSVAEVNAAPVLAAIGSQSVDEGKTLTFTVSATDTDTPPNGLSFSLAGAVPTGATIDRATGVFTWTPTTSQSGTYTFTVRVSDDGTPSESDEEAITVTVVEVNTAPVANGDSYTTAEDIPLVIAAPGVLSNDVDPDAADVLRAVLVTGPSSGTLALEANGSFTYTPAAEFSGSASFTYQVDDGSERSSAVTVQITVTPVNDAPVLDAIAAQSVDEGSTVTFTATGRDAEASSLSYSVVGAPAGAAIDPSTGAFSWTTGEGDGPNVHRFTVRISDGDLTGERSVDITVNEVNAQPALETVGNRSAEWGTAITFTASAIDSDEPANTLAYSLEPGVPAGASIVTGTGAFSWTPSSSQVGDHTISIRVQDGVGGSDVETFTVTVTGRQQTVTFDAVPTKVFGDGAFQVSATASSGLLVTFTAANDACAVGPSTLSGGVSRATVTLTDIGLDERGCRLTASQNGVDADGSAGYAPASDAQGFDVHTRIDVQPTMVVNAVSTKTTEFTMAIRTIRSPEGVVFDATRVDAATLTIQADGSTRVASVVRDNKGNLKAALMDIDFDGDLDLQVHFRRADAFGAEDVGKTHTMILNGGLKTVAGDTKRDGRPLRGTDLLRLDP